MSSEADTAKKVLVSGCFDLLHSGHVAFFRAAAQHGDLYVRLGSAANIKALKDHDVMYGDAERQFMVSNIACVHDAKISAGTGVYDFEADMALIKPDIYFVNDDASKLEGRVDICERLGIEMVIAPRDPEAGLKVRSSTSIKADLAKGKATEAAAAQAEFERAAQACLEEGVKPFDHTIPWRFCFCGGWLDLDWVNKYAKGCVVTINIKFNAKICKDRCGLATSSRKHCIKAWNGKIPSNLGAVQAAKYMWGIENFSRFSTGRRSYAAGSQDHLGLMFPGINKLNYGEPPSQFASSSITLNDLDDPAQAAIFAWLEKVLHVVEIPFVSRPSDFDSQRINLLKDPTVSEERKGEMAQAIADASEAAWNAIITMDTAGLGQALSATMRAWGVCLPYTVDPYLASPGYAGDATKSEQLRAFWTGYEAITEGCLFSGAGGGFLMCISEEETVKNGTKIELNHDFFCKPFPSAHIGDAPRDLTQFW